MSYTETTETSWFSRIKNSFAGMGVGIALFIGGTALLWWNEGSFVATQDALNETQAITQELGDIKTLNDSLNGKVVHASGFADTQDILDDPQFFVQEKCIVLQRTVQYYQWVEKSKQEKREKLGGGEETITTYSYRKEWTSKPVDSAQFRDPAARLNKPNILVMTVEPFEKYASNVTFGAYQLPDFMIRSMSPSKVITPKLSDEEKQEIQRQIYIGRPDLAPGRMSVQRRARFHHALRNEDGSLTEEVGSLIGDTAADAARSAIGRGGWVHVQQNRIHLGRSPQNPEIGDVRIIFKAAYPTDISIIAKLNGNTFEPFYTSNGKAISRLSTGIQSKENMFSDAHSENSMFTWICRIFGAILIIGGLKMFLAPLSVLVSVIPFLGSIVGAGTGLIAILLGGAWSLIVMAIAWLRFRPLIGGSLLAIALLLIAFSYFKGKNKPEVPTPS